MNKPDEAARLEKVYGQYLERDLENSKWSDANPGNRAMVQERRRVLQQLLKETGFLPLTDHRILEVGCGFGKVLAELQLWGASPRNLYGVDLLDDSIRIARRDYPQYQFQPASGEHLPFGESCFDMVLLFTVFTSILDDPVAAKVAAEVRRVLRPGGAVVWYDFRFNNPANPQVRGVSQRALERFFAGFAFHVQTVTLLPPLSRRLGRFTGLLYPLMVKLPWLRTHHAGVLVKPAG